MHQSSMAKPVVCFDRNNSFKTTLDAFQVFASILRLLVMIGFKFDFASLTRFEMEMVFKPKVLSKMVKSELVASNMNSEATKSRLTMF